jgi:acetylornithine deacetylase/succinyl-diaminopimelate desuccinylase-like protein
VQKNTIALIWKGEPERYDLSTSGKKASSGNSRGFFASQKGIGHSPKENTRLEDLEVGIERLTDALYKLAY